MCLNFWCDSVSFADLIADCVSLSVPRDARRNATLLRPQMNDANFTAATLSRGRDSYAFRIRKYALRQRILCPPSSNIEHAEQNLCYAYANLMPSILELMAANDVENTSYAL